MGRPRVHGDRTQVQVRLSSDLVARLDVEASDRLLSRNVIMERAIETFLLGLEAQKNWPTP